MPAKERGFQVNAADYLEQQLTLFTDYESGQENQDSSSGKTSQEPLARMGGLILEPCLRKSDRPKFQCLNVTSGHKAEWCSATNAKLRGEYWTLNIGESPNVAKESSLSQILQPPTDVQQKYYLSSRAVIGILRRAKERGKKLPEKLEKALIAQAELYGGAGQGTHNGAVFVPLKARCLTSRMDGSPCIDRGPQIVATYRNDVKTVGALMHRDYKGIDNQDLPKCDKLIIEKEQQ